jgi:TonB family protein
MFWIISSLFACFTNVEAQEFNFDDTGVEEAKYELDYVDLWPAKIVLDTSQNLFKLVWFETDTPRHTDIKLTDITQLRQVPAYEGYTQELQIHLKDGRYFLLDQGPTTRKTAQTFAVRAQTKIIDTTPQSKRIVPKPKPERSSPILVIGSINDPSALTPPSTIKVVTEKEADPSVDSTFDNSTLSSAAEKVSIDQTIKSNMGRFRSCYVKEGRKSPNLKGRIDIKFTVETDGTVSSAEIASSSMPSPLVEKCVVQQMQGLRFEPQKETQKDVVYPFVFTKQ